MTEKREVYNIDKADEFWPEMKIGPLPGLKVGNKVLIKDNAYEGTNDPHDYEARGQAGEVVWIIDEGAIEVRTDDGEIWPLTVDEIEELLAGNEARDV